jgi:hypothetical protein
VAQQPRLAPALGRDFLGEGGQVDESRDLGDGGAVGHEVAAALDTQVSLGRPVQMLVHDDLLDAHAIGAYQDHTGTVCQLLVSRASLR